MSGLKEFIENEEFHKPANHYLISRELAGLTEAYDHHFLIASVEHYPSSKAGKVKINPLYNCETSNNFLFVRFKHSHSSIIRKVDRGPY